MSTIQIDRLLDTVVKQNCSDLHLTTGRPPTVRLHGSLRNLQTKTLESDDMVALMKSVTPEKNQQELQEVGSTDFGFAYGDAARFRVSVFRQRGDIAMVLRLIPNQLLTFEEIGLPEICRELIRRPRGLFIVTGPTGSGKSTLIRLLGRFYDFDDDQIFLDGIDLNQVHSSDLRRRVGVVLQEFHIFSGSIYDNIALGNPRVTRERAIEAAKTVNAHDFISQLPLAYDSPLTERGQNLSQGQRQLLAFARVLAADPEILVLDEATANIDTETELLIQEAVERLTKGRTSIIIAHRLQTIQEADRVLVLDQGQVAEIGNHEELLAAGGLYATLHSLQFQSDAEPDAFKPPTTTTTK